MSLLAGASTTAILGRKFDWNSVKRPFSMTGWVRFTTAPNLFGHAFANLSGTAKQYASLLWHQDGTGWACVADEMDSAGTECFPYADYSANNTVAAPAGVWYFGAVVYISLSYRWSMIFRNGVISRQAITVDNTTTLVASPYTHLTVGSIQGNAGTSQQNLSSNAGSYIAEPTLYNCELGYNDLVQLAQGASPLSVGPRSNLLSYYPLRGDLRDWGSSEIGLGDVGTTAYPRVYGDHPPVQPPTLGRQFFVGTPAKRKPFTFVAS